jgi:Nucleotidyltransferase
LAGISDDKAAFARVVTALRPYLGDVVFAGGWAHRLLALHELASPLDFQPVATADTDIATPGRLESRGLSIRELLQQAGFMEYLSGYETPPISGYRLGEEKGALYVEFLSPQSGGPNKRDGSSDATVAVAGVMAQELKYLEVLFSEPWSLQLNEANGFPLGKEGVAVRVPNPAAYLMHKVLVLAERKLNKQAKDVLYIHDTLLMFAGAFEQLRVAARLVTQAAHPKWVQTFHDLRKGQFRAVDDRLRGAARIAVESGRAAVSPEEMQRVCSQGLERVFGSGA